MGTELTWVYLLERDDGLLYVGLTGNVSARLRQHQTGRGSRFARHGRVRLVGALPVGNRLHAGQLERLVKRWSPEDKRRLFADQPPPPIATSYEAAVRLKLAIADAAFHQAELADAFARARAAIGGCAPAVAAFLDYLRMDLDAAGAWLCTPLPGGQCRPAELVLSQGPDLVLALMVRHHFGLPRPPRRQRVHR